MRSIIVRFVREGRGAIDIFLFMIFQNNRDSEVWIMEKKDELDTKNNSSS